MRTALYVLILIVALVFAGGCTKTEIPTVLDVFPTETPVITNDITGNEQAYAAWEYTTYTVPNVKNITISLPNDWSTFDGSENLKMGKTYTFNGVAARPPKGDAVVAVFQLDTYQIPGLDRMGNKGIITDRDYDDVIVGMLKNPQCTDVVKDPNFYIISGNPARMFDSGYLMQSGGEIGRMKSVLIAQPIDKQVVVVMLITNSDTSSESAYQGELILQSVR